MKDYEARIFQEPFRWDRNVVSIAVRDPQGAMLMPDGTWKTFEEGTLATDPIGIEVPAHAIEAIARAIADFQGHTSHADTEARVLREALDVERARVDRVLDR